MRSSAGSRWARGPSPAPPATSISTPRCPKAADQRCFRSRSREGVFLDIFDSAGPLGEAIIERRRQAPLSGRILWVVAPEDLALLKAFSDRPRDFDDLVTLLSRSRIAVDVPYIQKWARMLDESIGSDEVTERVHRALTSPRAKRS